MDIIFFPALAFQFSTAYLIKFIVWDEKVESISSTFVEKYERHPARKMAKSYFQSLNNFSLIFFESFFFFLKKNF